MENDQGVEKLTELEADTSLRLSSFPEVSSTSPTTRLRENHLEHEFENMSKTVSPTSSSNLINNTTVNTTQYATQRATGNTSLKLFKPGLKHDCVSRCVSHSKAESESESASVQPLSRPSEKEVQDEGNPVDGYSVSPCHSSSVVDSTVSYDFSDAWSTLCQVIAPKSGCAPCSLEPVECESPAGVMSTTADTSVTTTSSSSSIAATNASTIASTTAFTAVDITTSTNVDTIAPSNVPTTVDITTPTSGSLASTTTTTTTTTTATSLNTLNTPLDTIVNTHVDITDPAFSSTTAATPSTTSSPDVSDTISLPVCSCNPEFIQRSPSPLALLPKTVAPSLISMSRGSTASCAPLTCTPAAITYTPNCISNDVASTTACSHQHVEKDAPPSHMQCFVTPMPVSVDTLPSSPSSSTQTQSPGNSDDNHQLTNLSNSLLQQLTAAAAAVNYRSETFTEEPSSSTALEYRRERFFTPPVGKLHDPETYGINLSISGELVSAADVVVWEFPNLQKLHQLRQRLVSFMREHHLKQVFNLENVYRLVVC